jgi:hypothetical protein
MREYLNRHLFLFAMAALVLLAAGFGSALAGLEAK